MFPHRKATLAAALAIAGLAAGEASAQAKCGIAGDLPARTQAIAHAIQGRVDEGLRIAPDPFVAGYVAWLGRRYDVALDNMAKAAVQASQIKNRRTRSEGLARAGYWSSRILAEQGRHAEAQQMREATLTHKGTFYALLTDPVHGIPRRDSYPMPQFAYTDARTSNALVYAIAREESNFRATVTSSANAQGVMQVIPPTARRIAGWVNMSVDMKRLNSDMNYNVALGSTYLGFLLDRYKSYPPLAAAGYNAGEGCADKWIAALGDPRSQVDPLTWIEALPIKETRDYVKRVMGSYVVYVNHGAR